MELTECKDNERESRDYWEKRLEKHWDKPFHGMYFDSEEMIGKMDARNFCKIQETMKEVYELDVQENLGERKHRVLECGCGAGRYLPSLTGMMLLDKYVGVDFAKQNIDEANMLYKNTDVVSFIRADMKDVPNVVNYERFDLIFMVATLSSIQRNFNTIMKLLAPLRIRKEIPILVMEQDMIIEYYGNE